MNAHPERWIGKKPSAKRLRPRALASKAMPDPMSMLANLFDVAFVFALAFLVAMVTQFRMPELLSKDDTLTIIKNAGQPDMEIVVKKGKKLEHYKATDQSSGGSGKKLGTAYKLDSGEVVYVPEEKEENRLKTEE